MRAAKTDQTGRMPRLIWVFAGCTDHFVGFVVLRQKYVFFFFPFSGPAGTGKTESVKALGNQLGRFVLVFNCDETFDFQVGILIVRLAVWPSAIDCIQII